MTGHGDGSQRARSPRGPLDVAERRTADKIQSHRPRWIVLWGLWSRRYWAFALFDAGPDTIISARNPAELVALLDHAEAAATLGGAPRSPGDPRLRQ